MDGNGTGSSSKPCLASKPRALMIFHTIGLNTGKVRLDALIRGLSCALTRPRTAVAAVPPTIWARAVRREIFILLSGPEREALPARHSNRFDYTVRLTSKGHQNGLHPVRFTAP